MKNSIYNKREVPSIHPGCSLAETGASDYDDFDNPLEALEIIPKGKENEWLFKQVRTYMGFDGETVEVKYMLSPEAKAPSYVREEALVTITVPEGVHPITFLKETVANLEHAWVFVSKEVAERLRKLPTKYYQDTVAYGEFFRFETFDEISLQKVKYFDDWKVLYEWSFERERFMRPDAPEFIIQLEMKD